MDDHDDMTDLSARIAMAAEQAAGIQDAQARKIKELKHLLDENVLVARIRALEMGLETAVDALEGSISRPAEYAHAAAIRRLLDAPSGPIGPKAWERIRRPM
jgi:cell fate (sporulation/competence/biofilm development) regulator YlbF (YheA/YmcA/DUF963 family)